MLLNRINIEHTMTEWLRERNPPRSLKEKWFNQITNTVRILHHHGIVWGDVKPENVVIALAGVESTEIVDGIQSRRVLRS
jgi:serine/threonine protein kinase